mgnify:CR=1 FL=1
MLWYFDPIDGYPAPWVHALIHNTFGAFLAWALRKVTPDTNPDLVISREARRRIALMGAGGACEIIPTADIGRSYKCVLKHLGQYTFEDYKNLALVYGKHVFAGDDVMPAKVRGMYDNLVTAIAHYSSFGDFTNAARKEAWLALLAYAQTVEQEPECQQLLTPSLHVCLCRWVDWITH